MSSSEKPPRQRVERVAGSRRAKLTPAPGTTNEPTETDAEGAASASSDPLGPGVVGPNDERLRRDVPPHY